MTASVKVLPTYSTFTDLSGFPLDLGYIYIGQENQNPETNPIQVYYDAALTTPAAQPIRTLGGYPARNGSPALLFVNSNYSITVRDKNRRVMYSSGNVLADGFSSNFIIYNPTWENSISRTLTNRLMDFVSAKDFGLNASYSSAQNNQAIIDALAVAGFVYIPAGSYDITGEIYQYGFGKRLIGAGVNSTVLNVTGNNPGIIVGNPVTASEENHDCNLSDMTITGGTYPVQIGTENSPLTTIGDFSRLKLSAGSSGGLFLYQGIVSINDCLIRNNYRGLVTLSLGNGGGTNSACMFNRTRIYQNENEGAYLEQAWNFSFNSCNLESNGKEGLKLQKYNGTILDSIALNSCFFEGNLADGTITTSSGNIKSVAGLSTKASNVSIRNTVFNGVIGSGTGNIHVYGDFDSINFDKNSYAGPAVGAINITGPNCTGFSTDTNESFANSAKINIIDSYDNKINGDLAVTGELSASAGAGEDSIIATTGNIKTVDGQINGYNSTTSNGDIFSGFHINTGGTSLAARRLNCGSDADRVGLLLGVASVINSHYWSDNSGVLRFNSALPTSATDGVAVGSQTFSATHIYFEGDNDLKIGESVKLKDRKIYRTTTPKDASCIGVYAGKSNSLITSFKEDVKKSYKKGKSGSNFYIENKDKASAVISLGDTIFDQNDIQIMGVLVDCKVSTGDYLCTGNTSGKLTKQDDDIFHSYTIAKAMENGDENGPVYSYILS